MHTQNAAKNYSTYSLVISKILRSCVLLKIKTKVSSKLCQNPSQVIIMAFLPTLPKGSTGTITDSAYVSVAYLYTKKLGRR